MKDELRRPMTLLVLNQMLHLTGIWITFPVTEFVVCIIAVVLSERIGRVMRADYG